MKNSLFSLKTYRLIFLFYRKYLWITTGITLIQYALLKSINVDGILFKILLAKLILLVLAIPFTFDIRSTNKMVFFQNFGISRLLIFSISFLIDGVLTIITIKILQQFSYLKSTM